MRFVAGRGAVAERHREAVAGGGAVTELLLAEALRRRAIGKLLLAGAPWRNCWYGQPADAAAGITGSKKQHREEGAMAKVPGSYVKFGKECTFAA